MRLAGFLGERRGSAAVEFAFWLAALTVPVLGATDIGFYAFQSMQAHEAAEAAAQAALELCAGDASPIDTNCSGLNTVLANTVKSTSLGTQVSLATSYESYYCVTTAGALTAVGTAGTISTSGYASNTAPSGAGQCSSFGSAYSGNTNTSGDYVRVNVTYAYKPMFSALSVASLLGGTTINGSALMRVN